MLLLHVLNPVICPACLHTTRRPLADLVILQGQVDEPIVFLFRHLELLVHLAIKLFLLHANNIGILFVVFVWAWADLPSCRFGSVLLFESFD
jgi:hypothetical protein